IKVLISSSNWPRYQANANIPIEQGDFFRRTPGDGQTYSFEGTIYSPRVANQEVYFSPNQPSQIIFPFYGGVSDPYKNNDPELGDREWLIYPNPIQNEFSILSKLDTPYT